MNGLLLTTKCIGSALKILNKTKQPPTKGTIQMPMSTTQTRITFKPLSNLEMSDLVMRRARALASKAETGEQHAELCWLYDIADRLKRSNQLPSYENAIMAFENCECDANETLQLLLALYHNRPRP
jgi:hypothetical protein